MLPVIPVFASLLSTIRWRSSLVQVRKAGSPSPAPGDGVEIILEAEFFFFTIDAKIVDVENFDVRCGLASGVAFDECKLAGCQIFARIQAIEIFNFGGTDVRSTSS